jgi:hypothetical protein
MGSLHLSLVKEVLEVQVFSFIPVPTVGTVVINMSSNDRGRWIRSWSQTGRTPSMGIGVMCHTADDTILERSQNKVSPGVIDRHLS